nr:hypothetical protein [Pyrinomonadaceae bacterium]
AVFRTEVSGSFAAGISDQSRGRVVLKDVYVFDNYPNLEGFRGRNNDEDDDNRDDRR